MTDTAASSPLSDLQEPSMPIETTPKLDEPGPPPPPPQVQTDEPGLKPELTSPVASTSAFVSTSAPTRKKPAGQTRRKSSGSSGKKLANNAKALSTPDAEACPACQHLETSTQKAKQALETVWVECDQCEAWFHWSCVSDNPAESPEVVDKWYCGPCLTASLSSSTPLAISYNTKLSMDSSAGVSRTSASSNAPNVRKSGRATKSQIDYSNLHLHLPASVDRWSHVISARTSSGQIKPDEFERKKPEELTVDWIYGEEGMLEPFVVETPEGLGMTMPRRDITVQEIAELIGPQTPLEVIDCASQSSLANWTLGQWAQYYSSPDRDKVRNVISLEVSETKLGKMVVAPELVRNLDWVDTIWPDDMKQPGQFPRVQKYCLMSVEKCWTDWHVDFAGSSVFYHVLKGGKTFYFIRPTPSNLAAYERWSGSTERQEQEWLGDSCDEVLKIELKEGNTAFLPTGWIHAVYTPADSIVIGGNFLHSLNIPTQLRIYEIELATKVPKKFRYPHFVKLLWLVAIHYNYHLARMTLPPTSESPLPHTVSPRVLEGLVALSSFLINQTSRFLRSPNVSAERRRIARENVPWNKVADPVGLSREFRKNVFRAMAKEFDADCFKPHGVEEDDASGIGSTTNGGAATRKGGTKRKGTEEAMGVSKSAKLKIPSHAGSPPRIAATDLNNKGEIISRQSVPVPPSIRSELRTDPKRPEVGLRPAEISDTRNSQAVVRRWEDNGETFVETRTVHTIIERVKFSNIKAEEVPRRSTQASYQPYVVAPPTLPPHSHHPPPTIANYPYPAPYSQPSSTYQPSHFQQRPPFTVHPQAQSSGTLPTPQVMFPPTYQPHPSSQVSQVSFATSSRSQDPPNQFRANGTISGDGGSRGQGNEGEKSQ